FEHIRQVERFIDENGEERFELRELIENILRLV
ncbi:hypothetical protein E3A20_24320, partial [Planctomyces bekefii]